MPVGRLVAGEGYRAGIGQVSVEQLSDSTLERRESHRSVDVEELACLHSHCESSDAKDGNEDSRHERLAIKEVVGAEGDVFGMLVSRPALAGTLLNGESVKVLRSSVDS